MDNAEIADRLEAFAALLELADANPYTMRAYRVPRRRPPSSAAPVAELVRSRRAREAPRDRPRHERVARARGDGQHRGAGGLRQEIAPDLVGLGRYLGLGARRSVEVARALGVRTAEEFREAAAAGPAGP